MKTCRIKGHHGQSRQRRGFTLIELLVVISIIAVLMSLILPAVQSARAAARRTQCQNHLKNVTLGIYNGATAKNGDLPAVGTYGDRMNGGTPTLQPGRYDLRSWVVSILPYIDKQDVYDRWDNDRDYWNNNDDDGDGSTNRNLQQGVSISVLKCPDDDTADGNALKSYVVNVGYTKPQGDHTNGWRYNARYNDIELDWDGSGNINNADRNVNRRSGLCFRRDNKSTVAGFTETQTAVSLDDIYDGVSQTILVAENLQAGRWGRGDWRHSGFAAVLDATTVGAQTAYQNPKLADGFGINEDRVSNDGDAPTPSSGHAGGVNVSYADGRVKFLNEDVDEGVFIKLVSASGARQSGMPSTTSGVLAAQSPLSDGDF